MKKILCYGDSNTFGFNPNDGSRYNKNTRWTGILQNLLKEEYKVYEEGGCDRTGFVYNPKGDLFSSQIHFPRVLKNYNNLDILVLFIGTNDLQFLYDTDRKIIEQGLEKFIKIGKGAAEKIILIPPVIMNEDVLRGYFQIQFNEESILKSQKVGEIYNKLGEKYGCYIFDVNKYVSPSEKDGLHYDEKGHKIIAEKLVEFILRNK